MKYLICFLISAVMMSYTYSGKDTQKPIHEWFDYTGFIGKYPVTMKLFIDERPGNYVKVTGTYFYNKEARKIKVAGRWYWGSRSLPSIELEEKFNNKITGSFYLKPNDNYYSTLNGYWIGTSSNSKGKDVKLKKLK